jgi:hypothetical protein
VEAAPEIDTGEALPEPAVKHNISIADCHLQDEVEKDVPGEAVCGDRLVKMVSESDAGEAGENAGEKGSVPAAAASSFFCASSMGKASSSVSSCWSAAERTGQKGVKTGGMASTAANAPYTSGRQSVDA